MGVKGLMQLIADACPQALKETGADSYFGRKVALDASLALYSFLIALSPLSGSFLTNPSGDDTSYLMGLWSRTLRLVACGIKPAFVFDSVRALGAAAQPQSAAHSPPGARRVVRVTPTHIEECKKLLGLMGMPVVQAPAGGEAEAQCAELCRAGKVFAVGSEDMDALTFGAPVLLRHLTFSEARKLPIVEIELPKVLEGLGLTMEQFIDLCILAGCDYCDTIRGVGPKRALALIKQHGSVEQVIKNLDKAKNPLPDQFPFEATRELFKHPNVIPGDEVELQWGSPDEEGLLEYLVAEKGFNEERVRKGIATLKAGRKPQPVQGRIDSFFTSAGKSSSSTLKKEA
ncbi:uncharacterized protein ACA1_089310 [Acanthamoeba castellanii str. Neff]|uniref:Flap endonuclease 1 n=1 Tax=Acanthamoeba castellanii (strain ATCC 30010 / Neff) TaxID=1257118 RepID=L8GVR2_ACACF|nr:uncharacterized protein ACA1_089310 [Acanthamoeba castellanii str. Neff]ELR16683.1 hypothetical protein ACA1_089310 [Acanthamoeba castellanii str. Neff]